MTSPAALQALLDDLRLDLEQCCRSAGVDAQWLQQHIAEGLVHAAAGASGEWQFDAIALRRVRRLVRLERDFDAAPELAALVADLEDEVRALRARLRRQGFEP